MPDHLSRVLSLAPLAAIVIAAGCAGRTATDSESAQPMAHRAPPPPPPVIYSDVRADDLIPQEYRVHPGDVLQISLSDLVGPGVETQKTVRVSVDGTISLPLIGKVHVAGLTEAELGRAVNQAFRDSGVHW
jgi:protein involved in polysaccharide export with SLBB domain